MQQELGCRKQGNPQLDLQAREKRAARGSLFLGLFLKCQNKQMVCPHF